MREHRHDLGQLVGDRPLDLRGDVVRLLEREVARKLQVKRDLVRVAEVDDADVVHLSHARHGERRHGRPLAERLLPGLGLDVDDHVALGQRPLNRVLDRVGGRVALADRGSGGHADHDVHEVTSAGLAHPQPLQVHRRLELRRSRRGRRLRRPPARGPSARRRCAASGAQAATRTRAATKSAAAESALG